MPAEDTTATFIFFISFSNLSATVFLIWEYFWGKVFYARSVARPSWSWSSSGEITVVASEICPKYAYLAIHSEIKRHVDTTKCPYINFFFRPLVTITYVIFCTKYCEGWSTSTPQMCYIEIWNQVIYCWIPLVTLRSATLVWRELRIQNTIMQVFLRSMWQQDGTELRKLCLIPRY